MSQTTVAADETAKKSKLVPILLVLLLAVGAAAGWMFFARPTAEAAEPEPVDGEIVTFDPLTTTLGLATTSHARVAMAVVLVEGADPHEVEAKKPLLQDALLQEVAQMNADALRSAEGSAELRRALTADAKEIWGDEVVRRVVLTELLVQ